MASKRLTMHGALPTYHIFVLGTSIVRFHFTNERTVSGGIWTNESAPLCYRDIRQSSLTFRVKALRGRSTEVTACLTVVVTVREVSLCYGPTQLAPPAQSSRHQPGTLPRLPRLAGGGAGGGGGDGGGGGGGEEAARMRMIGLPIISYLEHNNNNILSALPTPHRTPLCSI